jgi:hypothetical protein
MGAGIEHSDIRSVGRKALKQGGAIMRLLLFAVGCLSMALAACGQPVQDSGATAGASTPTDANGVEIVQPEVLEALRHVPAARPYVGPEGRFDYGAARSDLGAVEARELRSAWRDALSIATAEA